MSCVFSYAMLDLMSSMSSHTVIAFGNFFFGLCSAITIYIFLPYLTSFMPAAYSGLVIAGGALIACSIFPLLPHLVVRFGAQRLALFFGFSEMLALLMLAFMPGAIAGAIFVAVTIAMQPFIAYTLDILLEATVSEETTTGRVRAVYLTAWSLAGLFAPLLLGVLLADSEAYRSVFLLGAVAFVPFLTLFAARRLPTMKNLPLSHMSDSVRCILNDRDLSAITFCNLLLYLFFMWAPLYVTAYLHTVLGFAWSDLSFIFFLMLLPYVVIQYPAGILADRYFGEKEMLFAGFLIAGASLAAVGLFSTTTPLFIIATVLIISRIGAALIESMTQAHFFRRITERDINSISVFRGIWPIANVIAPSVGSLLLFFGSYPLLFFITGGFLALAGAIATLRIKDFR